MERTHAWQNVFHRLAQCYERRATAIDAFFDLADAIVTVRSLVRQVWTTHRWDERPHRRPGPTLGARDLWGQTLAHYRAFHLGRVKQARCLVC